MLKIVKLVDKGPTSTKNDDDLSDRLNSRYTVLILVVFTLVVSSQLYIGKPITCWCPKEFSGSWIKYTNNYCWVKNTYYLPLTDRIPKPHSGEREDREILYYQWLPFIMLGQAVFFYLPSVVWHAFNQKAGVDCDSILATANKYQNEQKQEGRTRLLKLITGQMDRFLLSKHGEIGGTMKIRNVIRKIICCGGIHGYYLIFLYMFSKLLYLANVVAQFFVLNAILRTDYALFGHELVDNLIKNSHWIHSGNFPRVTMCDYTIRRLGNLHRYTVQCTLPINMYAEKIYAFMWVWMLFIAIISGLSFLQWFLRIFLGPDKYRYVRGHIRNACGFEEIVNPVEHKHRVAEFVDTYLRQDGVFILRLIGHNTNNMTAIDITKAVWENWQANNYKRTDGDLDDVDKTLEKH